MECKVSKEEDERRERPNKKENISLERGDKLGECEVSKEEGKKGEHLLSNIRQTGLSVRCRKRRTDEEK